MGGVSRVLLLLLLSLVSVLLIFVSCCLNWSRRLCLHGDTDMQTDRQHVTSRPCHCMTNDCHESCVENICAAGFLDTGAVGKRHWPND